MDLAPCHISSGDPFKVPRMLRHTTKTYEKNFSYCVHGKGYTLLPLLAILGLKLILPPSVPRKLTAGGDCG